MQKVKHEILVWLPSPVGDAILSTPALRAIRRKFTFSRISFFAKPAIREVLSPNGFNDAWLEQTDKNPFKIAKMLRPHKFTLAILLKNSFASALAVCLAGIPSRIGYVREGRSLFLTDRLHPPRLSGRRFKPISMIDYYLAVPSWLGANTTNRSLKLSVDPQDEQQARAKLPEVFSCKGPIVVLVPGGAFGPSKCWPSDRFAQIADWLIEKYNAMVVISVASDPGEKYIAGEICDLSKHKLFSLAQTPISLGQLKALFAKADLAVSNDTGPRHIAVALCRKVITLFGPNDPAWTDTGYDRPGRIPDMRMRSKLLAKPLVLPVPSRFAKNPNICVCRQSLLIWFPMPQGNCWRISRRSA
jgi:heptosyltransferase-2